MSEAEDRLRDDRANRQAARQLFDANLGQVRADLKARGIGGRVADQAKSEVTEAVAQGLEVASESKGVIAATVGLLALWFFRAPLLRRLDAWLGKSPDDAAADPSNGD